MSTRISGTLLSHCYCILHSCVVFSGSRLSICRSRHSCCSAELEEGLHARVRRDFQGLLHHSSRTVQGLLYTTATTLHGKSYHTYSPDIHLFVVSIGVKKKHIFKMGLPWIYQCFAYCFSHSKLLSNAATAKCLFGISILYIKCI